MCKNISKHCDAYITHGFDTTDDNCNKYKLRHNALCVHCIVISMDLHPYGFSLSIYVKCYDMTF